jgi:hypothetical protein
MAILAIAVVWDYDRFGAKNDSFPESPHFQLSESIHTPESIEGADQNTKLGKKL